MMKQTDETCCVNMILPDAIINVRVYYPYQPKSQVGKENKSDDNKFTDDFFTIRKIYWNL